MCVAFLGTKTLSDEAIKRYLENSMDSNNNSWTTPCETLRCVAGVFDEQCYPSLSVVQETPFWKTVERHGTK